MDIQGSSAPKMLLTKGKQLSDLEGGALGCVHLESGFTFSEYRLGCFKSCPCSIFGNHYEALLKKYKTKQRRLRNLQNDAINFSLHNIGLVKTSVHFTFIENVYHRGQ